MRKIKLDKLGRHGTIQTCVNYCDRLISAEKIRQLNLDGLRYTDDPIALK